MSRRLQTHSFCATITIRVESGFVARNAFIRSVGAAGAQVPYKHKVGGSNPSPTTIERKSQASPGFFRRRSVSGETPLLLFSGGARQRLTPRFDRVQLCRCKMRAMRVSCFRMNRASSVHDRVKFRDRLLQVCARSAHAARCVHAGMLLSSCLNVRSR